MLVIVNAIYLQYDFRHYNLYVEQTYIFSSHVDSHINHPCLSREFHEHVPLDNFVSIVWFCLIHLKLQKITVFKKLNIDENALCDSH